MTITTESTESRKDKAYNAGKDFALGSSDESCTSDTHWQTREIAAEWERGYSDHDPINR